MKPPFREDKATQAAAILLKLGGGHMNYMKLIKLLYIIDREALLSWGRPVTFDAYVSMDNGPVLSRTYSLITDGIEPTHKEHSSCWNNIISAPERYEVKLLQDYFLTDELSEAEEKLIQDVFNKYGHMNQWELVDIVHKFSEWQDPDGSAIPIDCIDILEAGGKTKIEAATIKDDLESLALLDRILS